MPLTRRELELQKNQSLQEYKDLVVKEARHHLKQQGCTEVCTDHLRNIHQKGQFRDDVLQIVNDSLYYFQSNP